MKISNGLFLTSISNLTFFKYLSLSFLLFIFSQNSFGQGCTELPGGIVVSEISGNGINCDYEIDLCVDVPNSPRPKRIDYQIMYDSNGDGFKDTDMLFSFSPGGQISTGTHCLSALAPSEVFIVNNVLCGSEFEVTITGYTNNSGGSGGSCATTLGIITESGGYLPQGAPLPVELVSFSGQSTEINNSLKWATATEKDVDYFIIERMGNNETEFYEVGRINAVGNSTSLLTYSWDDFDPSYFDYYRLNIIDLDGSWEYSNVISIKKEVLGLKLQPIFPNPVSTHASIEFVTISKTVIIDIFNQQGQLILQREIASDDGLNNLDLDMSNFARGIYFLNMNDGRTSIQQKFIKI